MSQFKLTKHTGQALDDLLNEIDPDADGSFLDSAWYTDITTHINWLASQHTKNEVTASGATTTIDLDNGRAIVCDLEVATTAISFTNAKAGFDWCLLRYRQDVTGSRVVTHPAGTLFAHGIEPSLSTAAGAVDDWFYYTYDGGTVWNAAFFNQDVS
jgi:hypothetical protein